MNDAKLLSIVDELIRSLESARDELYARNSMGARIINDQIEGVRAELAAMVLVRPTLAARLTGWLGARGAGPKQST